MPSIKTGISLRVGSKNFNTVDDAFKEFMHQTNLIRRTLGDMTRPFNHIAGALLPRIKDRFNTGELGLPPYREEAYEKSRFTKASRKAKGLSVLGSTLKQTGKLQKAIERKRSPTRGKIGEQREVFRLVIGVNASAAPYYKIQLMGGIWRVPIRKGPKGGNWFDPNRLEGTQMTSERFWGPKKWSQLSTYPEATKVVTVPPTNFFFISTEDKQVITKIFVNWYSKIFMKTLSSKGEVPF